MDILTPSVGAEEVDRAGALQLLLRRWRVQAVGIADLDPSEPAAAFSSFRIFIHVRPIGERTVLMYDYPVPAPGHLDDVENWTEMILHEMLEELHSRKPRLTKLVSRAL